MKKLPQHKMVKCPIRDGTGNMLRKLKYAVKGNDVEGVEKLLAKLAPAPGHCNESFEEGARDRQLAKAIELSRLQVEKAQEILKKLESFASRRSAMAI